MTKNIKSKPLGDGPIFFGGVDRKVDRDGELDPDGAILSEFPAFYHSQHIEELKEEISSLERNLNRYKREKIFDEEGLYRQARSIKAKKAKLQLIEQSKPSLNATQQDKLWKISQDLQKEIKDLLFTQSQMKLGTVSAHEEADRMVDKRISVDKLGIDPQMAEELNMKLEAGKASRGDLERVLKIINKSLGEDSNISNLRPDRVTFRGRG